MKYIFKNRINFLFMVLTGIVIFLLSYLRDDIHVQNYINSGLQTENAITFQLNDIDTKKYSQLINCLDNGQLLLFPLNIQLMGVYTKNYSFPLLQEGESFTVNDFNGETYSALVGTNIYKKLNFDMKTKLNALGIDWNVIGILSYRYQTILDDMILFNSTDFSLMFPLSGKIILDGSSDLQKTFQKICVIFPEIQIIKTNYYDKIVYQNSIDTVLLFIVIISFSISILLSYCLFVSQKNACNIFFTLGCKAIHAIKYLLIPYYCNTFIGFFIAFVLTANYIGTNNIFNSLKFTFFYFLLLLCINSVWIAFLYYDQFYKRR